MLTVKFICISAEDGFDPKDLEILAKQPVMYWQELSPEQQACGLYPVYAESENSHVFGFIPGHVVAECPDLLYDLAAELKMHADDLDYEPAIDPALGIKIEIYNGFLED